MSFSRSKRFTYSEPPLQPKDMRKNVVDSRENKKIVTNDLLQECKRKSMRLRQTVVREIEKKPSCVKSWANTNICKDITSQKPSSYQSPQTKNRINFTNIKKSKDLKQTTNDKLKCDLNKSVKNKQEKKENTTIYCFNDSILSNSNNTTFEDAMEDNMDEPTKENGFIGRNEQLTNKSPTNKNKFFGFLTKLTTAKKTNRNEETRPKVVVDTEIAFHTARGKFEQIFHNALSISGGESKRKQSLSERKNSNLNQILLEDLQKKCNHTLENLFRALIDIVDRYGTGKKNKEAEDIKFLLDQLHKERQYTEHLKASYGRLLAKAQNKVSEQAVLIDSLGTELEAYILGEKLEQLLKQKSFQ